MYNILLQLIGNGMEGNEMLGGRGGVKMIPLPLVFQFTEQ